MKQRVTAIKLIEGIKEIAWLKEETQKSKVNDNNFDCADSHWSSCDNDHELYLFSSKRYKQHNSSKKGITLKTTNILTSKFVLTLDRTKVRDQNTMYISLVTVQSLGHNI